MPLKKKVSNPETDLYYVLAVMDKATDEIARYAIVKASLQLEDEDEVVERARIESFQYAKIVAEAKGVNASKVLHRKLTAELPKFSVNDLKADPHKLPALDERLPDTPRERAAVFRGLPQERQDEFIYSIITRTGAPIKRLRSWLCLNADELDHIDKKVIEAAQADLELRIAKNMIGFAMANKSPVAQTATMFLSKTILGMNESGPQAEATSNSVDINIKVVDNKNPELEALRGELDVMVAAADAKAATYQ